MLEKMALTGIGNNLQEGFLSLKENNRSMVIGLTVYSKYRKVGFFSEDFPYTAF